MSTKTYAYDYDDYEDGKGAKELCEDILADPEFKDLTEIVVGNWGDPWEDSVQDLIDGIVEHAEQFAHIEKLFIGDMGYEDCEVSWIMQGDYSKLWAALPGLKELTIKGSTDLVLGDICHEGLEALTIICGGLPTYVIESIQKAKLPKLKKLLLYIGVGNYGFDGDADTVKKLLEDADFPELTYLGITDSEIQDELTQVVLECKYMNQIDTLDLSMGSLTDKGGELILEKLPGYPNIKKLNLHYNYLSEEMAEKLSKLPIEVDVSERNKPYTYSDGDVWFGAMLTE